MNGEIVGSRRALNVFLRHMTALTLPFVRNGDGGTSILQEHLDLALCHCNVWNGRNKLQDRDISIPIVPLGMLNGSL